MQTGHSPPFSPSDCRMMPLSRVPSSPQTHHSQGCLWRGWQEWPESPEKALDVSWHRPHQPLWLTHWSVCTGRLRVSSRDHCTGSAGLKADKALSKPQGLVRGKRCGSSSTRVPTYLQSLCLLKQPRQLTLNMGKDIIISQHPPSRLLMGGLASHTGRYWIRDHSRNISATDSDEAIHFPL